MERRSFLKGLIIAAVAVMTPGIALPKIDPKKTAYTFAMTAEMLKDPQEFELELNYLLRSKGLRDPDEIVIGYDGTDFVDNVFRVVCYYKN